MYNVFESQYNFFARLFPPGIKNGDDINETVMYIDVIELVFFLNSRSHSYTDYTLTISHLCNHACYLVGCVLGQISFVCVCTAQDWKKIRFT